MGQRLGVPSTAFDDFARRHADYVQIAQELLDDDDGYWKQGVGATCGGARSAAASFLNCRTEFGAADSPTDSRDLIILEAYQDQLVVEPRRRLNTAEDRQRLTDLIECCFPTAISYRVRAGHQWVITGDGGFRHSIKTDSAEGPRGKRRCVPDCNPLRSLLGSRAFETTCDASCDRSANPDGVCPPSSQPTPCSPNESGIPAVGGPTREDVACIVPSASFLADNPDHPCVFQNLTHRLALYRGARINEETSALEPRLSERGMVFSWQVVGGFRPLLANLASQTASVSPQSMVFVPQIGTIAVVDGASEGLAFVSPRDHRGVTRVLLRGGGPWGGRAARRARTPVMRQFAAAKAAYPDAILFFRMGDFYEMFEDDAVVAARLLDLTLTSRNKGKPDEVPMAGVPHHAGHVYAARLLALGHKVAICEQMADPSKVKGIVPREVVRVLTPGLVTDGQQLEASTNNWLAALDVDDSGAGIALLDVSTGELRAAAVSDLASVLGELARSGPREVLVGGAADTGETAEAVGAALPGAAVRSDSALAEEEALPALGDLSEDAARLEPRARAAVVRALRFARACTPSAELPVRRIGSWDPSTALVIDRVAQQHLELVESASGDRDATLLSVIDATRTPAGARLLRRRLLAPLTDVGRIRRRLDAVELFTVHSALRVELSGALGDVGDLERLGVRALLGEATPRDLGALRDGLRASQRVVEVLDAVGDPSLRETLRLGPAGESGVDVLTELADELARALVDRPPAQPKDGAIFRDGYDSALSELATLKHNGTEQIVQLEAELRESTGIPTLKVRFTRVFGWYVEVSKSHAAKAPADWRRKQTVASGERFTTAPLDDLADRIASAEDGHRERELELLGRLVSEVAEHNERIATLAARIARWDVAAGLAEVAHRYDYGRPAIDESDVVEIVEGRHPVVERLAAAGRFVPNDVRVEAGGQRLWIVTGPNMAGKSTLLRQVALTVILAQLGSYVPARSARIGVVDRVLSRVGASDNLARGESTFMVEMRETADILRDATPRSLVILDEIGRGTSTFDGLAIAWAVAEHLDEAIGCRALFATHYHELTTLAETSDHVANYCVTARELDDDVVFLHRLVPGAASRSYGVAVAKLAGLPESVLARARALLGTLEAGGSAPSGSGPRRKRRPSASQLDLFAPAAEGAPRGARGRRDDPERRHRSTDSDRRSRSSGQAQEAAVSRVLRPGGILPRMAFDDRDLILRRRARFLSSALAALSGCAPTPPAEHPEPGVVAVPSAEREEPPQGSPPPERERPPPRWGDMPPLDVPPGLDAEATRLLTDLAATMNDVHPELDAIEAGLRSDCRPEDPSCASHFKALLGKRRQIEGKLRFTRPFCPAKSKDQELAVSRIDAHLDYIAKRNQAIDETIESLLARGGPDARSRWARYRSESFAAHPQICLSVACP